MFLLETLVRPTKEKVTMGKFARAMAHVKNVTADPAVTAGKFIGHGTKTLASKVTTAAHNGMDSVRAEERLIEVRKEAKAQAKALINDATEPIEVPAVEVTPRPAKANTAKKGASKPRQRQNA